MKVIVQPLNGIHRCLNFYEDLATKATYQWLKAKRQSVLWLDIDTTLIMKVGAIPHQFLGQPKNV